MKSEPTVKSQLVGGVFYTALSKYVGIIVSLVVSAILARLISPEDFGVVAVATVLITFFSIFSDLGIGPAIVQNQSLNKDDLSSIFFIYVVCCCSYILNLFLLFMGYCMVL